MNKTPRLGNSDIEYLDKVWNFSSGCGKGCPYCYAKKITKRFPNHYPNEFFPTLYPEALLSPLYLKKPSRIGVCYMGDLFWDCPEFDPDKVIDGWLAQGFGVLGTATLKETIQAVISRCPQHTFIFLTKQPQNLRKFSPFPDNCWVGVSATDNEMAYNASANLATVKANIKYISFEPLLGRISPAILDLLTDKLGVQWVIIGARHMPKKEWVNEIIDACDKAGIPVFLKNNLAKLFGWANKPNILRQEMPIENKKKESKP